MPTSSFFVLAAAKHARLIAICLAACLAGCAQAPPASVAVAPPPPKAAVGFDDAVASVTEALFQRAQPGITEHRTLVIDPLIDRATGNQGDATRRMEMRIAAAVRERQPGIEVKPFTAENLDQQPLLLVGSITSVAGPGVIPFTTDGPVKTYRIWAALTDLRTGRVLSREMAWAKPEGVSMIPTAFFRDSPVWSNDPVMAAYLRTCSSKPGDPIDPAYLRSLRAAAAFDEGKTAYESGHYGDALTYYAQARSAPEGDQLRVYNGIYLAYQALGRDHEAERAFGQLVDNGLSRGKLAVKFVFRPNSTQFWPDPQISGSYPMWLRQIARQAADRDACMKLLGHTSPTGTVAGNEILSERRAQTVRARLIQQAPPLKTRTVAIGRGSSEPLVGTGRDDATDVLDRRVEFAPEPCAAAVRADAGPTTRYAVAMR